MERTDSLSKVSDVELHSRYDLLLDMELQYDPDDVFNDDLSCEDIVVLDKIREEK